MPGFLTHIALCVGEIFVGGFCVGRLLFSFYRRLFAVLETVVYFTASIAYPALIA